MDSADQRPAGAGTTVRRAEPDRAPLRFEALRLPQDTAALVGFLTRQPWTFHVGTTLAPADVKARVAAGGYDGPTTRTFWTVDETAPSGRADPSGRAGLVRLEGVGDGDPLFDLRVDAGHRGRGIATATVGWLTRWLFTELPDVGRIEAQTRVDNGAMRRVLERCGYAKEAHYRRAWPDEGGAVHDGVGYAVLRHDRESGTVTPVGWDG